MHDACNAVLSCNACQKQGYCEHVQITTYTCGHSSGLPSFFLSGYLSSKYGTILSLSYSHLPLSFSFMKGICLLPSHTSLILQQTGHVRCSDIRQTAAIKSISDFACTQGKSKGGYRRLTSLAFSAHRASFCDKRCPSLPWSSSYGERKDLQRTRPS